MKTKNPKKTKVIFGVTAALSCIALVGTGYSAWVISTSVLSGNGSVSVTASDVKDQRVTISNVTVDASEKYSFQSNGAVTGTYISGEDGDVEDLSASFSFTLTMGEDVTSSYYIYLSLADTSTSPTLSSDVSNGYISAPITVGASNYTLLGTATASALTISANTSDLTTAGIKVSSNTTEGGTYVITVQADFDWGTIFGGVNPTSWDGQGTNGATTDLDTAIAGITALYALNNATFNYTITASATTLGA